MSLVSALKIIKGLEAVDPPLEQSVLTVGNFDGVHLAHQQLLAQAGLFGAATGGPVVVLTFEPHPLAVVGPGKAPPRLSLPDEKLRLLGEAGAEIVVVAESKPDLLGMEAERFVKEVIHGRFNPTHIVEGPSFGFGRGRKGTPELLARVAGGFRCEVHILEPVTLRINGETMMVSSTLVRRLLEEGKVHRAALCLGRPFALVGEVVPGDARGREIGFPTANLAVVDQLIPRDGVYAGVAVVGSERYACAISIGNTPTFGGTEKRIEGHILDFEGEIYGERIRLEFDRLLRPQVKYDSPEELTRQLWQDVQAVRDGTNVDRAEIRDREAGLS
jgi:riboflavin kinase/FMN adenylyltransferase